MFTQHEVLTAESFQLSLWIIYIYPEQKRVAQIALKRKVDIKNTPDWIPLLSSF